MRHRSTERFYVDGRLGYKSLVDPEGGNTRRVLAILVADLSGFSALMGQDDERTARDVRRIQKLVATISRT